jgi:hypothetical protein
MTIGNRLGDRLAIGDALGKVRVSNQESAALVSSQRANFKRVIIQAGPGSGSFDERNELCSHTPA